MNISGGLLFTILPFPSVTFLFPPTYYPISQLFVLPLHPETRDILRLNEDI